MLKLGQLMDVARVIAGVPTREEVTTLEARLKEETAARAQLAEALNDSEARRRQLEALLEPPAGSDLERWREANEDDLTNPDPAVSQSEGVLAFRTLLERVTLYRNALNRDQTGLGQALDLITKIAGGYMWVTEGRGPYEWDDVRYREETGTALSTIIATAREALRRSGNLATSVLREGKMLPDGGPVSVGVAVAALLVDERRLAAVLEREWDHLGFVEIFPMLPRWGGLDAREQKAFVRIGQALLREALRLAVHAPSPSAVGAVSPALATTEGTPS
jgi:nitrogen regulatory protein PII-like uncharacterized protein